MESHSERKVVLDYATHSEAFQVSVAASIIANSGVDVVHYYYPTEGGKLKIEKFSHEDEKKLGELPMFALKNNFHGKKCPEDMGAMVKKAAHNLKSADTIGCAFLEANLCDLGAHEINPSYKELAEELGFNKQFTEKVGLYSSHIGILGDEDTSKLGINIKEFNFMPVPKTGFKEWYKKYCDTSGGGGSYRLEHSIDGEGEEDASERSFYDAKSHIDGEEDASVQSQYYDATSHIDGEEDVGDDANEQASANVDYSKYTTNHDKKSSLIHAKTTYRFKSDSDNLANINNPHEVKEHHVNPNLRGSDHNVESSFLEDGALSLSGAGAVDALAEMTE